MGERRGGAGKAGSRADEGAVTTALPFPASECKSASAAPLPPATVRAVGTQCCARRARGRARCRCSGCTSAQHSPSAARAP